MTTKSKKKASKPAQKKGPRSHAALRALAARVTAVHEIETDAAVGVLQTKDEKKPGIPDYTLVVSAFGHEVARKAFSAEQVAETPVEAPAPAPAEPEAPKAKADKGPAPKEGSLAIGTVLVREYRKRGEDPTTVAVEITERGIESRGQVWSSLTALAKAVTGYPSISGPAFFFTAAKGGAR